MNLFNLFKLPWMFYQAFIQDGRRLYRLLPRPFKRSFWFLFVIQFLSALTETLTLLVISMFAVSVAAPEAARNNFIVKAALGLVPALEAYCAEHRHLVIFTSLFMTAFILFKVIFSALVAHRTTIFSEKISLHIGLETLRRYLNKSYLWHISPASQSIIHRFGQRGQLTAFLVALLLAYSYMLCCLTLFTSLLLVEPRLTLALIVIFSSCSLATYFFLRHRLDWAGQKTNSLAMAESTDRLILTQSLREVLLYRRQDMFYRKMATTIADGEAPRAALAFYGQLPSCVLELVGFSSISLLTIIMLVFGTPMAVIVSSTSMLMLTAWRVLPAVTRTLNYFVTIRATRAAAQVCLELLETFITEEVEGPPEPDPSFCFRQSLSLEKAGFTYPGAKKPALVDLNLTIRQGEKIGFIGASGVGKSTLAMLLSGLVQPQPGRMIVDGKELTPAGWAAYVRLLGFVPQSPLLLPGTVADNVAFSRWGEKYDRSEVEEICRRAALDFVLEDHQGLDRHLAGGSQGLSGGQAQRVAIARALFTRPEIIIFDEATSALDQTNENIIAKTIAGLSSRTTVILIAHRLTTVENCDRLIWLEEGKVKAEGPTAEILLRYQRAIQAQPTQ